MLICLTAIVKETLDFRPLDPHVAPGGKVRGAPHQPPGLTSNWIRQQKCNIFNSPRKASTKKPAGLPNTIKTELASTESAISAFCVGSPPQSDISTTKTTETSRNILGKYNPLPTSPLCHEDIITDKQGNDFPSTQLPGFPTIFPPRPNTWRRV
ncbi:hypothetical protein BV25DRAFT_1269423 [Artomyces pyxidatus]|uniref:Uncharacterized protein n=1 Tax=Artomyces pyxidatus TaxID=48021 RepID=A0ACB8TF27_9AGAM|nr:hypothetical protein BV25DRAFT_1269423 [Artomyces pyxidatus]